MSVFLLTSFCPVEKLYGLNVLKVIPIQVSEVQCLSHKRRASQGYITGTPPSPWAASLHSVLDMPCAPGKVGLPE